MGGRGKGRVLSCGSATRGSMGNGWVKTGEGMKNQMGYLDLHLESVMYIEPSYLTMNKIDILSLI